MHPNAALLHRLYTALNHDDHLTMASCYDPKATFHDIVFHLKGKTRVHRMWQMICEKSDIEAKFEIVHADDVSGRVNLVDKYTFSDTGYPVYNVIDSRFRFQDGLIVEHTDSCDPRAWATMALGEGMKGYLAGRLRLFRSIKANWKLWKFTWTHRWRSFAGKTDPVIPEHNSALNCGSDPARREN